MLMSDVKDKECEMKMLKIRKYILMYSCPLPFTT